MPTRNAPGSPRLLLRRLREAMAEPVNAQARLDRIVVQDDAVGVLDFKTNRPPPARAEDVPDVYLRQMAVYRAALALVYPGKRIDCYLLWTDGARLIPLPAALLIQGPNPASP